MFIFFTDPHEGTKRDKWGMVSPWVYDIKHITACVGRCWLHPEANLDKTSMNISIMAPYGTCGPLVFGGKLGGGAPHRILAISYQELEALGSREVTLGDI